MKNKSGALEVQRWPSGQQAQIMPTKMPGTAVSHFHTHPNAGPQWDQGPSWFWDKGIERGDVPFARSVGKAGFVINEKHYVYYDGSGEREKWAR